jgi:hypothetical protein
MIRVPVRISEQSGSELALEAVDAAAAEALELPVPCTRTLAVALVRLLYFGRPSSPLERWPFTTSGMRW